MRKQWIDFIFFGSKITAVSDCRHEIKRHLLLGRKALTNLGSVLKSRDIILLTKVHIIKAMVFPVVMYRCESWTIRKAEHWRINAFELWCWRRLLRVPWTARRSNESILKEINTVYLLEGLKLKLQYFGQIQRAYSLEKTLTLGKVKGRRRGGWQGMKWLDSITDSMEVNLSKLQVIVKDRGAQHTTVHEITKTPHSQQHEFTESRTSGVCCASQVPMCVEPPEPVLTSSQVIPKLLFLEPSLKGL